MQLLQALARVRNFIEQRRSLRQRSRCPAWIEFDDDTPPMRCTVLDISDGGARIAIARVGWLPDEFLLILEDDVSHARRCRIVWRGEGEIGISYLDPYLG